MVPTLLPVGLSTLLPHKQYNYRDSLNRFWCISITFVVPTWLPVNLPTLLFYFLIYISKIVLKLPIFLLVGVGEFLSHSNFYYHIIILMNSCDKNAIVIVETMESLGNHNNLCGYSHSFTIATNHMAHMCPV